MTARYTTYPLPPYRYRPGARATTEHTSDLHPDADHFPDIDRHLLPAARWRECRGYLYGVDLYNGGYWWEAHEVWEDLWHQADKRGARGQFLQGLIQIAAAHLKRELRTFRGMARLYGRGVAHLDVARAAGGRVFMGLDLDVFAGRVSDYFTGVSTVFPKLSLQN